MEHSKFSTRPCSIPGYCLLVDKWTGGDKLSLQMPIEIAEYIVQACNLYKEFLDACELAINELDGIATNQEPTIRHRPAYRALQTAIAKATGKE